MEEIIKILRDEGWTCINIGKRSSVFKKADMTLRISNNLSSEDIKKYLPETVKIFREKLRR